LTPPPIAMKTESPVLEMFHEDAPVLEEMKIDHMM
tara:strand:+ start:579 stop:683 length:105 start_codon:yes stop_codon:yes gene_type:complete